MILFMKVGKIKSGFISNDIRFNAGYFLNEDAINSRIVESNSSKCRQLFELAEVWNPPIFKRQFCANSERAVPYFQSSDVTNALEGSDVFINKKQAYKVGSIVEKDQILVTGFGTIGNTRLVNELSHGSSFANNVCRIKANENVPIGYVYAFMTSKYGKSQLNKNASGSVVRYIESPGIKKTLIPILPEETQQKIHNLIVESAQLRVEANKLLREAVEKIENFLREDNSKKSLTGKVSISAIKNNYQSRIDSPTYVNSSVTFWNQKKESKINFFSIEELGFKVTRPGIFKRVKVDGTNGIPYIKGSELNKLNPFSNCEYLSKSRTPFLDELKLKVNQILFTCAGTVGHVRLISKEFEDFNAVGSQDIIRIEENISSVSVYYLFAFLKTNFAREFAQSLKYGSVIERVEPFHVDLIPVAIPEEKIYSEIISAVAKYNDAMYMAFNNEKNAIDLIEKEIDQWQQ